MAWCLAAQDSIAQGPPERFRWAGVRSRRRLAPPSKGSLLRRHWSTGRWGGSGAGNVDARRSAKALVSWTLSAVLAGSAGAQPAPSPPLPGGGETISVRVVNLEVEVTDAAGQPVRGLHSSDFSLRVAGHELPIDFFSEVRDALTVAEASDTA